jgi:hypothetical protein
MTTKCANPVCTRPFLYFRSGKIYLIDVPTCSDGVFPDSAKRDTEYFWLCGACCQNMQVTLDRKGQVVVETVVTASAGDQHCNPAMRTRRLSEPPRDERPSERGSRADNLLLLFPAHKKFQQIYCERGRIHAIHIREHHHSDALRGRH